MNRRWIVVATLKRGVLPKPEPVDEWTQMKIDISIELDSAENRPQTTVERDVFWEVKSA